MKPEQREEFLSHLAKLYAHLKKNLKLKKSPKVVLDEDRKNADKMLGKTGYYDPNTQVVHLFILDRHPKDILRSFAHEIVHHWQHEHKQLEKGKKGEEHDPQYAQHDPWMRQMEKQAYLLGNMMFRDWEDKKKNGDKKSGKTVSEGTDGVNDKPFKTPQAKFKVTKTFRDGSKEVIFPVSYKYNGGTTIKGEWYPGFEVPPPKVPAGYKLVSLGVGLQLNAKPPYATMLLKKI